jgi:molecular chaperone GrpE
MTSGGEQDDLHDGENPEDVGPESDDFDEDIEDLENQEGAGDEDEDDVEIAPEPIVLTPEEQISELKDQLLRALAETQNVRRRADRDRADASKYAVTNFARDMLTVADNLRRTIDSAKPNAADAAKQARAADAAKQASATDAATGQSEAPEGAEPSAAQALLDGVEMTERDLLASLERHGIKVVSPMGKPFDHNFHQAIFEVETADKEPGVIVQVIQDGFVIGDRLLRPAMVGIAKAPAAGAPDGGDPDGESGGNLDTEA